MEQTQKHTCCCSALPLRIRPWKAHWLAAWWITKQFYCTRINVREVGIPAKTLKMHGLNTQRWCIQHEGWMCRADWWKSAAGRDTSFSEQIFFPKDLSQQWWDQAANGSWLVSGGVVSQHVLAAYFWMLFYCQRNIPQINQGQWRMDGKPGQRSCLVEQNIKWLVVEFLNSSS